METPGNAYEIKKKWTVDTASQSSSYTRLHIKFVDDTCQLLGEKCDTAGSVHALPINKATLRSPIFVNPSGYDTVEKVTDLIGTEAKISRYGTVLDWIAFV